ncbi:fasciclin domain-containing protein [Reichenbachiella ulvae]|uniref:Fasciclin domain-containing protein n=1 Tax=Reichenbachiella ulvae TaxID=2980104 RepID=A0ABT3CVZ6_9BACT|nr:fasciclin domain-containing protein [Reichenbachiella ulvae]MCV9387875.1 fasciclin domain-containing protein [Reichenbachiella ulvae]
MKMKLNQIVAAAVIVTAMASCSAPADQQSSEKQEAALSHPKGQASVSDDVSERNILQVAVSSKDHSTLVAAVEAAQIEHVLVNAGPLTVFAPVNEAFEALPEGTVENLLKPENKAQLANILTRHAAPGSYDLEALKKESRKGRKLYMATGDYLEVVVDGDQVSVAGAKILATIPTSNGIIQVVDRVILPNS